VRDGWAPGRSFFSAFPVQDLWTIPWPRAPDFFRRALPLTKLPLSSAQAGFTSAFFSSPFLSEICCEGFPQLHQKY
jgi:hypothetical protein